MTRDEARGVAERAMQDLWGASASLRVERYRRWLLVGPLRWEAFGRADGRTVHVVMDDASGQVVEARRGASGLLATTPESTKVEQIQRLLLVIAMGGLVLVLWDLTPSVIRDVTTVVGLLACALGILLWMRVRIMERGRKP